MRYQIALGLVTALAFAPVVAAKGSAHHWETSPHHLSTLVGTTYTKECGNAFTIGIDYEYRVSDFLGVGFVAQNIINNFISGWILMWERPIRIGDTLEVDDTRGRVEAINTRSTRIRRVDGVHILVPNSKLLENTVINWNLVNTETRTSVKVGVAYGSSVREVEQLIYSAVGKLDGVLKTPAPAVMFDDFGDNALNFEVYYWLNASSEMERRKSRSDLRFLICEAFEKAGIVVAFPQRDVHIDGELKLTSADKAL